MKETEFVQETVQRLATTHPRAFVFCEACKTKPPCAHNPVGLGTLWEMAHELWAARPAHHRRQEG